jgi:hypothetical protein
MATYRPPLHGVSFSEALAEAAAIAPLRRVILSTFELHHSSLTEPIYIVNDYESLAATIEDGAPRNANEEVTFLACPVEVDRPEESDQAATPEVTISVANVSGIWSEALRAARGSSDLWSITERVYASDDLSSPAVLPPTTLTVTRTTLTGSMATLTASFGDSVNRSVPRITFTITNYPGLTAR